MSLGSRVRLRSQVFRLQSVWRSEPESTLKDSGTTGFRVLGLGLGFRVSMMFRLRVVCQNAESSFKPQLWMLKQRQTSVYSLGA